MLFELTNEDARVKTHSGVLEFIAEEGRVYIPQWMMKTLKLNPGQILKCSSCDLPLGNFVKIEPQSTDFLDITDPKAVLENVLRKFSTLTVEDIIEVNYNDTTYAIKVLEVKPDQNSHGICVVETDLETDFAPPVGYIEPEYTPKATKNANTLLDPSKFNKAAGAATMAKSINYAKLVAEGSKNNTFQGSGQKVSGKPISDSVKSYKLDDIDINAPPVALNLPSNQLFFGFPITLSTPEATDDDESTIKIDAFSGTGQSLRQSKKRKDENKSHPSLKNHTRSPEYIEID